MSNLRLDFFFAAMTQMLNRGGLMLATIIVSNSLSSSDFAAYSYFLLTMNMLSAYGSLGVGVASARTFAKSRYENRDFTAEVLSLWAFPIALSAILIIFLSIDPISITPGATEFLDSLFIFGVALSVLGSVSSGAIVGLKVFKQSAIVSILCFLIIVGLSLCTQFKPDVNLAAFSIILAISIKTILEVFVSHSLIQLTIKTETIRKAFKNLAPTISLILPAAGVTLLSSSGAWISGQILKTNSAITEYSIFTIGLQWYALSLFVPGVISKIFFSRLVEAHSKQARDKRELIKLVNHGLRISLASGFAFTVIGYFAAPIALQFYGSAYQNSADTIRLFLFAGLCFCATNVIGNAFVTIGKQNYWLLLTAVWLVILLLVSYMLSYTGAIGVGVSYSVAGCALFVSSYAILVRVS